MATRVTGNEIGQEGLQRWNGLVSEAYLPKLQWPGAYAVYDEMRRRDPTLRSILNAVRLLGRQATWTVEPGDDSDGAKDAAAFVDSCLRDMSHTVDDFVDDALTMLPFGWSAAEIVYKRREDGRIGWKKLAPRRQSTLSRWDFDDEGGLQGWYQRAAPTFDEVRLPIEKLLHFVAERDGTNPEGLSLFESAYEPWYFVKNLQIISGIGWQRAFVGLPVFEFEEAPSPEDKAHVTSIANGLQVGSTQFVSVPPKVTFHLETVPNTSAESLLNTIRMYRIMMTQMVLADFIWLGTGDSGSWSLGSDKSQLFLIAVNGYLDRVAETWSRHGVVRLLSFSEWSGLTAAQRPRIVHSDVRKFKLGELGSFIQQIASFIPLYESDAVWLRNQAGLPKPSGEPLTEDADGDADGTSAVQDQDLPDRWEYPEERDPVGLTEIDNAIQLAEADYEREKERRSIEKGLTERIGDFLDEQLDRVIAVVSRGQNVGEDDAFWEAEETSLRSTFLGDLLRAVLDLAQMAIEDVEEDFAGGADWTQVNTAAAKWAREHAGDLISGITETTRDATRETVATWIETDGTLDDLIEDLAPTYGERRADMIGTTEVTRSFDEANDLVRQQVGLPAAKAKAPAHVKCRCYTRPVFTNGTWLIVWNTVRDERVCTQPLSMPWGRVVGCRGMHGLVVGGPDETIGRPLREVRRELKDD